MKFSSLEIQNLRNLTHIKFNPANHINFIVGENGSGKTSILEAIYLLGLGRSFRTHLMRRYIQHGQSKISLYSTIEFEENFKIPLGLEKKIGGESIVRLNGENINSIFELAQQIPLFLIHIDSFHLLTQGPNERRQFFDFGLFHVKHSFLKIWREYSSILKQRNAALRTKASNALISAWDVALVERGIMLFELRKDFLKEYQIFLNQYIQRFLQIQNIEMEFDAGWNTEFGLLDILKESLSRDRELGYTTKGPHRFDFKIKVAGLPVGDVLSRGQLKLFICALYFAMREFIFLQTGKKGILLIDDLPSEFDSTNFSRIMDVLSEVDAQIFLTSTQPELFSSYLSDDQNRMFHVKHGKLDPSSLRSSG